MTSSMMPSGMFVIATFFGPFDRTAAVLKSNRRE